MYVSAGHKPSQWSYVRQVNLRSTLSQVKSSVRVAVTSCPETEILYVLGKVGNDPAGDQFDLSMIEGHTNLVTETVEGNIWGDIDVGVALTVFVVAPGEVPMVTIKGNSVAPMRGENFPTGQREQVATLNSEYCPATQSLHDV